MLETEPPEDRLRRQLQELEEEVCSILPLMYWPYAEEGYQCTKLITTSIEASVLCNSERSATTTARLGRIFGGTSLLTHESSLLMARLLRPEQARLYAAEGRSG
jgi:hypothetical protein